MGTIKQGILGGFSGKVGTVVGGSWKSIHYMRALAVSVRNPRTVPQVLQRRRFTLAVDFAKTVAPFLRIGYGRYAKGQSAYNAAVSYILLHAMTGSSDNIRLDYRKLLVARGNLVAATGAAVEVTTGKADFSWTDNSGMGDASPDDQVLLLVYNKTRKEAVYSTSAGSRADASAELALPADWEEEPLSVYLAFCNPSDGYASNSVCLQDDADNTEPEPGGGSGETGGETGGGEDPLG